MYDRARMDFGRRLVNEGEYLGVKPVDRADSRTWERGDGIVDRIAYGTARGFRRW